MEVTEREQLRDLKDDVEAILDLDTNFLIAKMQEDPDSIIATIRSGFLLLYSILEEALNGDSPDDV